MKRVLRYSLGTCLILTSLTSSVGKMEARAEEPLSDPIELTQLIQEAVEKNPEIMAARNQWQSAQEIIQVRRSLPDPRVSYTYFVKNVETRVGPQDYIVGISQTFPFYNKRHLKAEVAAREADAAKASYGAVTQEIIRRVKTAFYELFYVSKMIDITTEEKEILKRFERIARTKYQTGQGNQQSILKTHVEITRLNDELLSLSARKKTAEATLNTLLDRATNSHLGKPAKPERRDFSYAKEELFRMAQEHRPELQAGVSQIEKSDAVHELAKKDYYPDLTIGANYIEVDKGPLPVNDNGQDAFNVMFSINVPIWQSKLSAQVNSALEMMKAQKSRYDNMLNRTLFEVEDGYFKIQTARDTLNLYEKVLIPQAEQSLKSAEAGYMTGIVGFLDLLDAQRVLLKIEHAYWRTYTDYLKQVADMERSVGADLAKDLPEDLPQGAKEG